MSEENLDAAIPCEHPIYIVAEFSEDSNSGFFLEYHKLGLLVSEPLTGSENEKRMYIITLIAVCIFIAAFGFTLFFLKFRSLSHRN